ncbi:MAG: hypothetical protein H7A31_00695 [Thermotogae bacterium]|nr:hypothetical protein [Thermotogota bacterium]MCP5465192.1 hypothetical protein [Thermotogota bacterium]
MRIAIPVKSDDAEKSIITENIIESDLFAMIDLENNSYSLGIINIPYEEKTVENLKDFLVEYDVDMVIADNIENETAKLLNGNRMQVFYGAQGDVQTLVQELVNLLASQEHSCGGGCSCGEEGCGEHDGCGCGEHDGCGCGEDHGSCNCGN